MILSILIILYWNSVANIFTILYSNFTIHLHYLRLFQVQTKEFVPANQNVDKETPVVSALTDAVEVTISNKQPKDRESPVKNRKHKEQPPKEQHKEFPNEPKETTEKQIVAKDETKHKETSASIPPVSLEPAANKDNKDISNINQREERKNQRKEKSETKVAPAVVAQGLLESPAHSAPVPVSQENSTASGK